MSLSKVFQQQVSPFLATEMARMGFEGSGFNFVKIGEQVIFAIGINPTGKDDYFCVEFALAWKSTFKYAAASFDVKNVKFTNGVLGIRLDKNGKGPYYQENRALWKFSNEERENHDTAIHILDMLKKDILPIVHLFETTPDLLETLDTKDFENNYLYRNALNSLGGVYLFGTEGMFIWAVATEFERKGNLAQAKQFAEYGIAKKSHANSFIAGWQLADFNKIIQKT